jgi:hypothetical protein
VTAASAAMQAENDEEPVDIYDIGCQALLKTAVRLCMIGCNLCESKAVDLYDDAEVRETIFRAFGEVSRSEFQALCAGAYKGKEWLACQLAVPQHDIDDYYGRVKGPNALQPFRQHPRLIPAMP